jgi:hypothetical protein
MGAKQNGGNGNSNASSAASGSKFDGNRPISRMVSGFFGVNLNTKTIKDFLEKGFFPPIAPLAALSVNNPIREVGSDRQYILTWSATKETNPITGITVDGAIITPTGSNQSGTQNGTASDNVNGSFNLIMSVTDGNLTTSASVTLSFEYGFFYGTINKSGLLGSEILDSDILALTKELRTDRRKSFTNFGGAAKYLIFAFPASFGTPVFTVNGLINTAFTKVRSNSNFVNSQGATILTDVWVSNNVYNSPLDSVIIS